MNRLLLTATAIFSLTAISACGNAQTSSQTSTTAVTDSANQGTPVATTPTNHTQTPAKSDISKEPKGQEKPTPKATTPEQKPAASPKNSKQDRQQASQTPKNRTTGPSRKTVGPVDTKKPKQTKHHKVAKTPNKVNSVPVGDTKTKKSPGYGGDDGSTEARVSKISKTQTPWGEKWSFTLTTMKGVSYKAGYVSNESLSDGDPEVAKQFKGKHVFELELRGILIPDAKSIDDAPLGATMPKDGGLTLVSSGTTMCGVHTTQLGFAKKHKFTLSKSTSQKNTIIIQVIK